MLLQRGGTEDQHTQHIRSKQATILCHAENAGHRRCVPWRSQFITSLSLNRSADTNPSFLGHKMIKRNLNTINVSTRWTVFTYEQFSIECFPQIYVIYIFCWFKDCQFQDLSSVYICLCKRRINSFSFKEKYSNWPQVNKQLLTEVSSAMFIFKQCLEELHQVYTKFLVFLVFNKVHRKWSTTTLIYTKTSFVKFLKNRILRSNITMNMLEETWTYYKYLNLYNSKH